MIRAFVLLLIVSFCGSAGAATRIKDVTAVQGIRDNPLVGYGLVVGLQGTGDSLRNSPFTEQSLRSMLDRMGVSIRRSSARSRNVAAVVVTATLPPFVNRGARIDVTISSLGDATSLIGGTLVLTPLVGPDGRAYAVAQGPIAVTGFSSSGQTETLTEGVATSGRIPNGALIERPFTAEFNDLPELELQVRNPDFATVLAIVDAVNAYTQEHYGVASAQELDFRTVRLTRPETVSASRFMAEIGNLLVEPDSPARVVIDEKTGTIVIGQNVQVSTVALTHGNLTVRVTESPRVSQPAPFSEGETTIEPETTISASEDGGQLMIVGGADLQTLVNGLNQIGLKPKGIIAILQTIKTAGALQAELVVQ